MQIYGTNAITGWEDQLHPHLVSAIDRASEIRLIVSFILESGAKLLAPKLKEAAERKVPIKILTGSYLAITEPSALYYLFDYLGDGAQIHFYEGEIRAFHPKAYLFDLEKDAEVFIGSSNLSRSALTSSIEWNYRFFKSEHPREYQKFSDTFQDLFENHSQPITPEVLKSYALSWKRADIIADPLPLLERPQPRGAQVEALYYLKRAREEGVEKGVVVAATGVGKTHLAAFDSESFTKVLFVAHREEIVQQAARVFHSIRPHAKIGFFTGTRKDQDADLYFSTIQTLSRREHLQEFAPDYFDYIIVDEFHHAAAKSYREVLAYFRPAFLLGLTATPFRMDNQDVFLLCDDNVIYELSFKQAIERDLLVPFHYNAAYDSITDYDLVRESHGSYVVEDLERELSRTERGDLVLAHYKKFAGERTLGFCASIKHADYMAAYFTSHGVPAVAVHSEGGSRRDSAIKALEQGTIKVIFAVDIFNEGVDIPSLDTVMFLRPTESYVIFLQQLGRGLRKSPEKTHLTVLDFIGNYKRAHYVPLLLAGENPQDPNVQRRRVIDYDYPDGCVVNFDFRVIELFEELAARDPLPVRMRDTYWRLKDQLGRRPTRLDLYQGSDVPLREYLKKGWLGFLASLDELSLEEEEWLGTDAEEFLQMLERTALTKAYKLPTIGAFLQEGTIVSEVKLERVGAEMMSFYKSNPVHQQDLINKAHRQWREWEQKDFSKLARKNPVHFLAKGRYFHFDEINQVFYLDQTLWPYLSPELAHHVEDILEQRRVDYFRRRYR